MKTKKNFLEIADLLKNNGVGFVKLYFKSNLSSEEIDNEDSNDKQLILDFSDGKEYLGSLVLKTKLIGTLTSGEGTKYGLLDAIFYSIPAEITGYNKVLGMEVYFIPAIGFRRGKCFIYEEDD